jgi:hypothetical protein
MRYPLAFSLFFVTCSSAAWAQAPGPVPVTNGQIRGYASIDTSNGAKLAVRFIPQKDQYCVDKSAFSDSKIEEPVCMTRKEWSKEGYIISGG